MKCTCSKDDLKSALQAVSKAVAEKPQTPVLAGIYLRAEDSMLEIQSTDFSLGIIAKIPANTEIEGELVVIGKKLTEISGKLSGEIVTITDEEEEAMATLKSDAAKYSLLTMSVEDFPKVKEDQEFTNSFKIRAIALKNLIRCSTFACSKDKSGKPMYLGCSIQINGSEITFVGTNTNRIAIDKEEILDNSEDFQCIIPARTLLDVSGMLDVKGNDKLVIVECSNRHVAFNFDNIFVSSRLIDGQFPPVEQVIPKSSDTVATIEVAEFREAIGRVELIARDTEYCTIKLAFSQDGLELSAIADNVGNFVEHVDAAVEGPDIEILVRVTYMIDVLKVFNEEKITIGMTKPLSAIKMCEIGNDNFVYVLMPTRSMRN